jgi:tetratricopeptide (TPR) repeat protein
VDAGSGVDLATATSRADGRENVLEAVDKLARDVRRDLGETRFDLIQNGGWFARATTSSLDALKAFTEGSRAWSAGKLDQARELWTQALTYDSTFAWAHVSLGLAASWFNDRPEAEKQFTAAEAHLDRLTERERLWLRSLIAGSRGRSQEAIDLLETYTRAYPDDRDAWYNLGSDYMRERRCDDAIPALQHALDIDSTMTNAFIQMATCYNNSHQPEEAIPLYQRAFALDSGAMTSGYINHEYGATLVEAGRFPEAEATFRRAMNFTADRAQQFGGRRSLALLRMFQGRYDEATDLLHDAATMARAANAGLTEYRNLLYLAAALRTKGDTAGLRAQLAAAERVRADSLYVPPFLLMVQGKLYAQAGDVSAADAIVAALDSAAGPTPTPDDQASAELLNGEVALARGDTQHAIEQLELAATRAPRPYFTEALARAYAKAGDVSRAIAEYEKVVEHVAFGTEGQEPWILAHVELGQLYEAQGEYAKAIAAYQQFVDLWRDADPDLARSVDEIRSHIETLRKAHDIG